MILNYSYSSITCVHIFNGWFGFKTGFPQKHEAPKITKTHTQKKSSMDCTVYTNFNYIESPVTVCGATTQELRKLVVKMHILNSNSASMLSLFQLKTQLSIRRWWANNLQGTFQAKLRLEESVFTSPHVLQMLPQDLSCCTIRHEAQESLSVQATQLTSLQASQVWTQAVESELSLAPVQPVVHLPLRPQGQIWTNEKMN